MSASALKWTEAQLRAIRTADRSLLVSAAAGSGKTAVLAERCAYLVCDAPRHLTPGAAQRLTQRLHFDDFAFFFRRAQRQ